MGRIQKHKRVVASAAGILLFWVLLCGVFAPTVVQAASPATRSVDITVEINQDGSAGITEVWDVTITDGTEYYLTKHDLLHGQEISGLSVTDETGREYTNIGEWDSDRSGSDKFGKSGLLRANGGYEICWGVYGDYGNHLYTVRYTMSGLLQKYDTADAINQTLVAKDLAVPPQKVSLVIRKEGFEFTRATTGVWGFGATGEIFVQNGQVELSTQGSMSKNQYIAVLVEFAPGLFTPAVDSGRSFEKAKTQALKGSNYTPDEEEGQGGSLAPNQGSSDFSNSSGGGATSFISRILSVLRAFIPLALIFLLTFFGFYKAHKGGKKSGGSNVDSMRNYKKVTYSREIPWNGSLEATYARLGELNQLSNEGTIIGAYLLRWVRSRQIEMVKYMGGFLGNKEEDALKLYEPRESMGSYERRLYDMLVAAAGSDWILQSKEFEKWSKTNYTKVQGWLELGKNNGKAEMRRLGACEVVDAKMLGFIPYHKTQYTEVGETYTRNMFGFKKYLEEFTIINEREVREVQLWDEYLVFAQVFGIADRVAEQFKQLYPDYFRQMAAQMGTNMDVFDVLLLTRMMNNYGRAAATGYRAGYNAAHSTSFSGGGGGFSGGGGGGGGGFSGGGGGGTR